MTLVSVTSGMLVNIEKLTSIEIVLSDITTSLSRQCRFNGHGVHFWSVAQHSLLVASLLPEELKLQGLLHDASEAYLGDVITPLKSNMPEYLKLEGKVQTAILSKYGLSYPLDPRVKDADRRALEMERNSLFKGGRPLPFAYMTMQQASSRLMGEINWHRMITPNLMAAKGMVKH